MPMCTCEPLYNNIIAHAQVSCVLADDDIMLTIKPGQVRMLLGLLSRLTSLNMYMYLPSSFLFVFSMAQPMGATHSVVVWQ